MPRLPDFRPPAGPGGQMPMRPPPLPIAGAGMGPGAMGQRTLLLGEDGNVYCANCKTPHPTQPGRMVPRRAVEFFKEVDDEGYRVSVKHCTQCGTKAGFRESTDFSCEACGHLNKIWKRARAPRKAPVAGPIQFRCPNPRCGQVLEAEQAEAGTRQHCPKCRCAVTVPGMKRSFDRHEPMPAPSHSNQARQPGAYGPG